MFSGDKRDVAEKVIDVLNRTPFGLSRKSAGSSLSRESAGSILNIRPEDAQVILEELVRKNRLVRWGSGWSATYSIPSRRDVVRLYSQGCPPGAVCHIYH